MERILVIDDESEAAAFVATVAETCGFEAVVAEDHERFDEYYRQCRPDAVVVDLQMPGIDGIEVLRFLARESIPVAVVLLSALDARVTAASLRIGENLGLDVIGALVKPVKVTELQALLSRIKAATPELYEADLSAAVTAGELRLHYQPKVCLSGPDAGRVAGVEALLRWEHPRLGLLPPGAFIGLAERTGVITPITDAVLDMAIRQAARWREAGLDLSIAVNISPRVLTSLDLPDRIARRADGARLPADKIVLETTETGAMDDNADIMDVLTRLRLKGFQLSIDDFGTGYSSLVQLYRMPFSEMKIDKSFVMALDDNPEAEVVVGALVDLAHNLSLSVCAEGIENEQVWHMLESLGCERAQGYYMSRPLPPDEIARWIAEWRGLRASVPLNSRAE